MGLDTVKDTRLELGGRQAGFVRLWFAPVFNACTVETFVFINDGDGKNEETLHVIATYCA